MQENTDTLAFYRKMILATAAIYFGLGIILFKEFPTLDLVCVCVDVGVGVGVCLSSCIYLVVVCVCVCVCV